MKIPNKYYFRLPTRQEYRKYTFKKADGVLKSLEYLVHTLLLEPSIEEFRYLEEIKITLTEEVGQRLEELIMLTDDSIEKIEVDISKPFCPKNMTKNEEMENFYKSFEDLIVQVLKKYKLLS